MSSPYIKKPKPIPTWNIATEWVGRYIPCRKRVHKGCYPCPLTFYKLVGLYGYNHRASKKRFFIRTIVPTRKSVLIMVTDTRAQPLKTVARDIYLYNKHNTTGGQLQAGWRANFCYLYNARTCARV